jgi:hypothetical protein
MYTHLSLLSSHFVCTDLIHFTPLYYISIFPARLSFLFIYYIPIVKVMVKVKLSLCFWLSTTPLMRIGEWRYGSTYSLTSVLDGGEWSASHAEVTSFLGRCFPVSRFRPTVQQIRVTSVCPCRVSHKLNLIYYTAENLQGFTWSWSESVLWPTGSIAERRMDTVPHPRTLQSLLFRNENLLWSRTPEKCDLYHQTEHNVTV